MDTMKLRRAAVLSRWLLEALALLSWFSNRLPPALALCAALLRRFPAVVFHPAFAFLLGNLIVVTLFVKPGGHPADVAPSSPPPPPSTAGDAPDHDGYCSCSYFSTGSAPHLQREEKDEEEEEVVPFEDKAVCLESTTSTTIAPATDYTSDTAAHASPEKCQQKGLSLLRTRSSELPIAAVAKVGTAEKLLRQSDTDVGVCRSAAEAWWPEEEEESGEDAEGEGGRRRKAASDDNEEFRRRIERFISKQLRFIEREEELLLLASKGAPVTFAVAAGGPGYRHRR